MLEYLINYGIGKHTVKYEDVDVIDKMNLQEQINKIRKDYYDLLNLLDEVQEKFLECNAKISRRTKEIISENVGSSMRNSVFSSDEEYVALEAEQTALKTGISMINNQIEFCKSDLRILNSVFYNKF